MVQKFVENTRLTSKKPSVAFTPQPTTRFQRRAVKLSDTNQGITQRNTQNIRLANRAVPLNPMFRGKPRSGNFGITTRTAGF